MNTASPIRKITMVITALLAWTGLVLQLYLVIEKALANNASLPAELLRYFSFFTILCNILVALCLTIPLLSPGSRSGKYFTRPVVQGAVMVYIAIVGITYTLLLRHIWDPQGLQLIADRLLHDVTPVLYLLFWLFFVPKGFLRWKHPFSWLVFPGLYLVYTLIRGTVVDWYPYPFIDVLQLGYAGMLKNALFMLVGFVVVGLLVVTLDVLFKKRITT